MRRPAHDTPGNGAGTDRDAIIRSVTDFLRAIQGSATITVQLSRGGSASWTIPESLPSPILAAHQDDEEASCEEDILQTLREVGSPLTTTPLLEAMEQAGRLWSERTVKEHLARMVRLEKLLLPPKGIIPRGYRLPEWGVPVHKCRRQ